MEALFHSRSFSKGKKEGKKALDILRGEPTKFPMAFSPISSFSKTLRAAAKREKEDYHFSVPRESVGIGDGASAGELQSPEYN